ncbi:MAG TPA: CDP-glycerol glycerophosphotransferase family protein [Nocardioides sp.]|nr:CDP-glycerol glycerophosphotransferase family protein [Nocardioides sp.]
MRKRFGSTPRRTRVTVVVTADDEDAEYVDEAITSLRGQTYEELEIIVSGHGEAGLIADTARRHQGEDYRLRILRGSVSGRGPARNRGAAAARGDYLMFVRGDDVVPPHGVERLVTSLEDSGSDLAVGRLTVGRTVHDSVLDPYDPAHEERRVGTTLAETPLAITDVGIGNRMFRTTFWRGTELEFADVESGDAELALTAYVRASAFDVLAQPTYTAMNRGHGTPLDQMYEAIADLYDWIEGQEATQERLAGLGSTELRDSWHLGVLDLAIVRYLDDVERADDAQWAALRDYVLRLDAAINPRVWARVRSENRVKLWLLMHDRREELEQFVAARWFERENRPTEVRDGIVYAVLPFFGDREVGVPDEQFVMHEAETPLRTILRSLRWSSAEAIELDLLVRIDQVDGAGERPDLEVSLVDAGSGERIGLSTRPRTDAEANLTIGHQHQDYSLGGCTAVVDAAELVRRSAERTAAGGPISWHVEVTARHRGLTRTGAALKRDERGAPGMLLTRHFGSRWVAGHRVNLAPDGEAGVRVAVLPQAQVRLIAAEVAGEGVTGRLESAGAELTGLVARYADGASTRCRLEPADSGYAFRLDLPRTKLTRPGQPRGHWTLRAIAKNGAERPIAWPGGAEEPWLGVGAGRAVLSVTNSGNVELVDSADVLLLDEVEPGVESIRVRGRWLGPPPGQASLVLSGKRATLAAEVSSDVAPGEFDATFPTRWDEWGLGDSVIPVGAYAFSLTCGPKRAGQLWLGPKLVESVGEFRIGDDVRVRPRRNGPEASGLMVAAALEPEAWGPRGQHILQEWHRSDVGPVDEHAIYLQSYRGATATDSQLALHEELRRRRPDLKLYWGIADYSSRVPEGGIPVLMRSREWYRVMSTSKYVVNNTDLDRWFTKRRGQVVVQTFHGYPAKSMGLRMWEAKKFTPRRIEVELGRTSRDWDLITTPAPEMDVYYRREFRYDGPILNQGYPRDDALVSPSAEGTRLATRKRLGIVDGQVAVLYAPTWRDDMATNFQSAKLIQHLDLESATERLGPNYVFLMRGHRFHAKGSDRQPGSAGLIDVTDYPEINDLILAADAAVLDYSSLRFDFALTGRPMVFLVPDLASYTGGLRGFLYDYTDTAPGPLLDDADQVVRALADLPTLVRDYGPAIAAFNKKYQYLQDGHAAERLATAMLEIGEREGAR